MNTNVIKKFEGSISNEDFIRGLLQVSKSNTLGEVWEANISCTKCIFAKQCQAMNQAVAEASEEGESHLYCREVISVLLGEIKVEDIT